MRQRMGLRRDGAFTLIELLVVVSIVALLVSILLPALTKAREQARRTICATGQRQLLTGMHMYAHENNGTLPVVIDVPGHLEFSHIIRFWEPADLAGALGGYCSYGQLLHTKVIEDTKPLFCPTAVVRGQYKVDPTPSYATFYWRFFTTKPLVSSEWPKLDALNPRMTLSADVFAMHKYAGDAPGGNYDPIERYFWHRDGINVGRTDTSVAWRWDSGNEILDALLPGGAWENSPQQFLKWVWVQLDDD